MNQNQNITVVQTNNNGCGGCGCGTIVSILVAMAFAGFLLEEYGPIVGAIVGAVVGAWGGLKVSGCSLDEINAMPEGQMTDKQSRACIIATLAAIFLGFAGWGFGAELQREIQDNARVIINLFSYKTA